jgi:DnaJ-class molecular chaperone
MTPAENNSQGELPVLETVCPACKGIGSFYMEGPCESCCGSGYVPTEAGEKLLALVRHNIRRLLDKP